MELWIGLVDHFPVQTLAELRHIGIEPNQLQITGAENGTADGSIALDDSIFTVAVTAGVAVWHILHHSGKHSGFVLLMQFPNRRGCGCFGLPEYPGPVCAELCFLSVDVLLCLMVDGGHGIFLTLLAALRDSGNGHIMLIPQLFHNLFQPVCRKAAHFHTATTGDSAGSKVESQLRSGGFGILAIQLKEIAYLIQNHIIRVTLFDPVVFPYLRGGLLGLQGIFLRQRLFRLDFVVLCLFLFGKIAAFPNQVGDPLGHLFPSEVDVRAVLLFIMQSLPVVIFAAVCCTGESVGTPTNAVFAFEEIHLLFIGVVPLEKYEDTAFTARKAAAVGHGGINLVLGDELLGCRYFRQLSSKGGAGQGQVFQVFPNLSRFVVVEAQQLPVLLVGRPEGGVFFRKGLTELRAVQLLGKPCGFFREPGSLNTGQTGQIPGISGFIAEIVVQMPKFFRKEGTFIARCLGQLHIGGKISVLQKLADALGGALPGNDLGGLVVTGCFAVGKMDTVLGIPCGDAADPVAAVIERFQYLGNLSGSFLLFKGCNHTLPLAVRVAAQPQHMVDVILGKRKSRGCFHILCFIYDSDLFVFGEEETQL